MILIIVIIIIFNSFSKDKCHKVAERLVQNKSSYPVTILTIHFIKMSLDVQ